MSIADLKARAAARTGAEMEQHAAALETFHALAPAGADPRWWAHAVRLAYIAHPSPTILNALWGADPRFSLEEVIEGIPSGPPQPWRAGDLASSVSVLIRNGDRGRKQFFIDESVYVRVALPLALELRPEAPSLLLVTDDARAMPAVAASLITKPSAHLLWTKDTPRLDADPGLPGPAGYCAAQSGLRRAGVTMSELHRAQYVDLLRSAAAGSWVGTLLGSNMVRIYNTLRCAWDVRGGRLALFTDLEAGNISDSEPMRASTNVLIRHWPCWSGPILT